MIDSSVLYTGIYCADKNDPVLNFCYESVRDEFFDDISGGEFVEGVVVYTSNTNGRKAYRAQKKFEEEYYDEYYKDLKEFCKTNKKKIIALIAGIAGLTIAAQLLIRRGAKKEAKALEGTIKELTNKSKNLKSEIDELDKVASRFMKARPGSKEADDAFAATGKRNELDVKRHGIEGELGMLVKNYNSICDRFHIKKKI